MSSDSEDSDGFLKVKPKDVKDKDKNGKKDKDKKDMEDMDKGKGKGKDMDMDDKDNKEEDKTDKDWDKRDKEDKDDEYSGSHSGFEGGSHLAMDGSTASEFLSSSGPDGYDSHSDGEEYPDTPPPYPSPKDQSQEFMLPPADVKSPSQLTSDVPSHPTMSSQAPPAGHRVSLHSDAPFPFDQSGPPVAYDIDGSSPIFIGSALFDSSVHPCKIGLHLLPTPIAVPYGGNEINHNGGYDLLPFVPDQMEWVPAQHGQIPPGRRPVEGGYEENGDKLYHAIADVNGTRVPGKTGEHLGAANIPFDGQELCYQQYEILCWKH